MSLKNNLFFQVLWFIQIHKIFVNAQNQGCETLTKSEYKHEYPRDYQTVSNVGECSQACRLTNWCQSMSYRSSSFSGSSSQDIGNCLLSHFKPEKLSSDVGKNLVKDPSWDVYSVSFESNCMSGGDPGPSEAEALLQLALKHMVAKVEELSLEHKKLKERFEENLERSEMEIRALRLLLMNMDIDGKIERNFDKILENEDEIEKLKEICRETNRELKDKDVGEAGIWSEFNGNKYTFLTDHKDLETCHQECKELGGQLASIHSSEENDFLADLMILNGRNKTTWIGGAYLGKFIWFDKTGWDFQNWHSDEPKKVGRLESCISFGFDQNSLENANKWQAGDCKGETDYDCLCKIAKKVDPDDDDDWGDW